MKKKLLLAASLVLLCGILLLTGCKGSGSLMSFAQDKKTDFKIVSFLEDEMKAKNFAADLVIKTGTKFSMVSKEEAGDHAIYIGTDEQMEGLGGTSPTMNTATCYEILVNKGNVYVCVGSEDIAESVLDTLKDNIVKIEKGKFGIPQSLSIQADYCSITETVPMFQGETVADTSELHDCGNGNFLTVYTYQKLTNTMQEINTYLATLAQNGFQLVQQNNMADNLFYLYSKGDAMVHCSYFPAKREFRVVYGPNNTLIPSATPVEDYQKLVTPSITTIGVTENEMNMVLQLADGSFIVIDGGWDKSAKMTKTLNEGAHNERVVNYYRDVERDMEATYQFMKQRTPGGGKPQVIWMVTHADPDHITMPARFFRDYKDKFDLKMIVHNVPNLYNIGLGTGTSTNNPDEFTAYAENFVKYAKENFPDVVDYVYHTGEILYLPGCECEFLITPGEDLWPETMSWMNHTSGTWRFTIEGRTIMIPGDADNSLCNHMVGLYGSYLKSDILQPNHHGANGATLGFYRNIDPIICMWQCQQYHLDYDNRHTGVASGWSFNKFLRTSKKVIAHLSSSETHTVLLPSLEIQ